MCRRDSAEKKVKKEDATPSTVALESFMITAVIDAHERVCVAVWNISEAYLSTDMDEEVIMILEGRLEELMAMMAPGIYLKLIHINKTNKLVEIR